MDKPILLQNMCCMHCYNPSLYQLITKPDPHSATCNCLIVNSNQLAVCRPYVQGIMYFVFYLLWLYTVNWLLVASTNSQTGNMTMTDAADAVRRTSLNWRGQRQQHIAMDIINENTRGFKKEMALVSTIRRSNRVIVALGIFIITVYFLLPSKAHSSSSHKEDLLVYDFRQGYDEPSHLTHMDVTGDLVPRDKLYVFQSNLLWVLRPIVYLTNLCFL